MEETEIGEVGVDKLNENTHEKAKEEKHRAPWLQWLALTTAIFAVLGAIASLRSGQLANNALLFMNESTLKQSQASDAWSYYQAKGIKQITREVESETLTAIHAPTELIDKSREEANRYKNEQDQIQENAKKLEEEQKELKEKSQQSLEKHHTFAYSITFLQVAIGLSAIAAFIERRRIWLFAIVCGLVGLIFLVQGFV